MLLLLPIATSAQSQEKTLKIVLDTELQVLDPIATTSYVTRTFAYLVFDTLVSMDSKGEFHPQMLESWQVSPDHMFYRFKLRPGLTWHDGTPVTSEDCVASLKRWGARDGLGRQMFAATKELKAIDAENFSLELSKPFGLVIDAIGKPSSNVPVMMPARLAATDPTKPIPEILGSGPFMFDAKAWRPGDRAVFTKFKAYKPRSEPADGLAGGKIVYFDRLELLSLPDSATQVAALQAGEIDYVQRTPPDFIEQLRKDKNIKMPDEGGLGQMMGAIRLNHAQPPFSNPLIRQAFMQLMDQKEFMAATGLPKDMYMDQCLSMFMCNAPLSSSDGTEAFRQPSIEKAKALLKQAGYNNEPAVVFQSTDVAIINAISLVTIDRMRKAGFNVVVRTTDWATVAQQRWNKEPVDKGGWSALPLIWSGYDLGSPLTHYGVAYNCTNGYPGWSCDERTTKLLTEFIQESDSAKRKVIAGELQARALETGSVGLAGQYSNPPAFRSDLKDMITIGLPVFWNVHR
jgi:peptide/nickel transport system substrate-binding protein